MDRLDSHQHFWKVARGDYKWLTPELGPIHRDFLPDDLAPLLARHDVRRTIAVQAADSVEETRFLLDLARQHAFVAGVVGWIDMEAADAPAVAAKLQQEGGGKLLGVRPMIQDLPDDQWMNRAALRPAFRALVDLRLRFDALIHPRHLAPLRELLHRHPDLKVVVDHGAKPRIRDAEFDDWAAGIKAIARESSAYCKLSGLLTEAAPGCDAAGLRRYVDHLLDCFGPRRLMWGSDWPVLNLAADYARWVDVADRALARLSDFDRQAVFARNAERFYGL